MRQLLIRTIDARPLALARIAVGISSLPIALESLFPMLDVASGDYLVLPVFNGSPPLTSIGVWALFAVSVTASVAMILGIAGRLPAILVSACAATALLSDQQLYSNHLLLLVMLSALLGLSGAAKAIRSVELNRTAQVPYWPAFLIKAQITTLYAWTAIAKINPQYLSGEVVGSNLREWVPVGIDLLPAVSVLSIAAEAFLAVALWVPFTRALGFLVGSGLHIGILVCLVNPAPLIPFALLMLSGYVLFAHDSLERGHWKKPTLTLRARERASTLVRTD